MKISLDGISLVFQFVSFDYFADQLAKLAIEEGTYKSLLPSKYFYKQNASISVCASGKRIGQKVNTLDQHTNSLKNLTLIDSNVVSTPI